MWATNFYKSFFQNQTNAVVVSETGLGQYLYDINSLRLREGAIFIYEV